MPTYEYACSTCDTTHEVQQKMTDATLTECPACGYSNLRKLFTNVGVVFKGSGFYRNDSRDARPSRRAQARPAGRLPARRQFVQRVLLGQRVDVRHLGVQRSSSGSSSSGSTSGGCGSSSRAPARRARRRAAPHRLVHLRTTPADLWTVVRRPAVPAPSVAVCPTSVPRMSPLRDLACDAHCDGGADPSQPLSRALGVLLGLSVLRSPVPHGGGRPPVPPRIRGRPRGRGRGAHRAVQPAVARVLTDGSAGRHRRRLGGCDRPVVAPGARVLDSCRGRMCAVRVIVGRRGPGGVSRPGAPAARQRRAGTRCRVVIRDSPD